MTIHDDDNVMQTPTARIVLSLILLPIFVFLAVMTAPSTPALVVGFGVAAVVSMLFMAWARAHEANRSSKSATVGGVGGGIGAALGYALIPRVEMVMFIIALVVIAVFVGMLVYSIGQKLSRA